MTVNPSGWRPSTPANEQASGGTTTGNRALMLEEPLLFEIGDTETTGVDFPDIKPAASRLGGLERSRPIGLAGLSEPEAVRHYTRLSRQNYAIDLGLFPLGSCTMKHNPRLNEKLARLPGFADIHPLQPQETVQGALELINELSFWLLDLTGMHGVAMSPKAGAHGELCGLLCIRAALEARGDAREVVLVPESAHGTNPATAAFAGYRVENIPANAAGRVMENSCSHAVRLLVLTMLRPRWSSSVGSFALPMRIASDSRTGGGPLEKHDATCAGTCH